MKSTVSSSQLVTSIYFYVIIGIKLPPVLMTLWLRETYVNIVLVWIFYKRYKQPVIDIPEDSQRLYVRRAGTIASVCPRRRDSVCTSDGQTWYHLHHPIEYQACVSTMIHCRERIEKTALKDEKCEHMKSIGRKGEQQNHANIGLFFLFFFFFLDFV